jgi:hypothetical protein
LDGIEYNNFILTELMLFAGVVPGCMHHCAYFYELLWSRTIYLHIRSLRPATHYQVDLTGTLDQVYLIPDSEWLA